jgi:hypothetical protein
MRHRSRDACASEFAAPQRKIRLNKKGGEAPKGACQPRPRSSDECHHSPMPSARLRAAFGGAPAFRRFTAALTTGYHPDGSAPEPGFLKARRNECFAAAQRFELSTLRADRSFCRPHSCLPWRKLRTLVCAAPGPPGSGSHQSARGRRIPLRFPKVPSRKAPLVSESVT